MIKHLIQTIVVTVLSLSAAFSQSYTTTHFNERSGFNASTVYKIIQDQKGFLWVGSNSGLIRYDGIKFKDYELSDGLLDLEVFNILVNNEGLLFLDNYSNQPNYFYNNRFFSIKDEPILKGLMHKRSLSRLNLNSQTNRILQFTLGSFFFHSILFQEEKVSKCDKISLETGSVITSVVSKKEFDYVFYTKGDSSFYNVYQGAERITEKKAPFFSNIPVLLDSLLCYADQKTLYFYRINSNHNFVFSHTLDIEQTVKALFTVNNQTWATLVEGGVIRINDESEIDLFLEKEIINTVFVDRESNIWIGTELNGLFCLKEHNVRNYGIDELKISKCVMSLANNGANQVFIGFNKVAIAEVRDGKIGLVINLNNKDKPDSRRIMKMNILKNRMYCATDDNMYQVNLNNSSLRAKLISAPKISSFKDFVFHQGDTYAGLSSSLVRISNGKAETIFNERTLTLEIDENNIIWFGTLSGLYSMRLAKIEKGIHRPIKTFDGKINDLCLVGDFIYLATDFGVWKINRKSKKIKKVCSKLDGLAGNQCNKVLYDRQTLWIGTTNGISKVPIDINGNVSKPIQSFFTSDGLLSNYINDLLIVNRDVWVATNEGMSVFSIDFLKKKRVNVLNIIDVSSDLEQLNLGVPIFIQPNKNNISISFANMSFFNDPNIQYAFRLLPHSKKWIYTKENRINFSELDPEKYTFEVKIVGNIKKENITRLKFEVFPSFFQSWYFKLILFLILLAIIGSIFFVRERAMKRKSNIKNTMSQLELQAIRAQINPHFIYNCLTSIKNTILKKKTAEADEQITIFAQLVRQTLHISQLNFISLVVELEYLNLYLMMEKIRFKEMLKYEFDVDKEIKLDQTYLPSMLIQPFIENAVKHGAPINEEIPSKIIIRFKKEASVLICEVIDNGPGIYHSRNIKSENYNSVGMMITSSRAKNYNMIYKTNIEIHASELENSGTMVTLKIPIKRNDENS